MATTATRVDKLAKLRTLVTSLARQCAQLNLGMTWTIYVPNATAAIFIYRETGSHMSKDLKMKKGKTGLKLSKKEIKKRKTLNTIQSGTNKKSKTTRK